MANSKISALTSASTPLAGTEVLPIVQSSTTKQVSVANLTGGRAISFLSANVGPNYASISGAVIDVGKDQNSPTRYGISNQNTGASATAGLDLEAAGGGWQLDVPADVVTFANPLIGKFGGTEKFRFLSTGSFKPVAGAGIDFSANSHAAGMTSELLTWYEEGTFSPYLSDGTNNTSTFTGYYTRIGRLITVHFQGYNISYSGLTAGSTVRLAGLPFNMGFGVVNGALSFPNATYPVILAQGVVSNSYVNLYVSNGASNTDWQAFTRTLIGGTNVSMYGQFSYLA